MISLYQGLQDLVDAWGEYSSEITSAFSEEFLIELLHNLILRQALTKSLEQKRFFPDSGSKIFQRYFPIFVKIYFLQCHVQ